MTSETVANNIARLERDLCPLLAPYTRCALLDYPNFANIGDHMIWLGTLFLLRDRCQVELSYVAHTDNFSAAQLNQSLGKQPILLHGGGNFGDLWPKYQHFREQIVRQYPDNPIFVFPQTIYYEDRDKLRHTASVFNRHPQLTLCTRDRQSYELARQHFHNCQVLQLPDPAFFLSAYLPDAPPSAPSAAVLYHCRRDRERRPHALPHLPLDAYQEADWVSFQWKLGNPKRRWQRNAADCYREIWQRGLQTPREWQYRQRQRRRFSEFPLPSWHRRSWSFLLSGIYQFRPYRLIITNRLHGHILCLLLEIPHVFLPNSYYKNAAFYQAWTADSPLVEFADSPEAIAASIERLRQRYAL